MSANARGEHVGRELCVDVREIPPSGLELESFIDGEALSKRINIPERSSTGPEAPRQEYWFDGPLDVQLRLDKEGRTVLVEGRISGAFRTECSRCADDVSREISVPVSLVMKPRSQRSGPEADVEDLHLGYYEQEEIDLQEALIDLLILGLPYTVLCRPECRGICPECGTNLNAASCSCHETQQGDDRWAVLKQLKLH